MGVLVFDASGSILLESGVGSRPALQHALRQQLAQAQAADADSATREDERTRLLTVTESPSGPAWLGLVIRDMMHTTIVLRPLETTSPLFDFLALVPFATEIMEFMISNPYQAMTVADAQGKMRYISPIHEQFLGLPRGGAAGRDAASVIPNSRLADVARTGKAEIAQLQNMHGVTRVVNRLPIQHRGRIIGAVGQVLFKDPESVLRMHRTVVNQRITQTDATQDGAQLLGNSAPMQRLRREIATVAHLDIPVLILGESGTGKELVAQAIHQASNTDESSPLVSLNLAALPATLLEAELFGYEPGTFTGGNRQGQLGRIEQARNGSLFLDEVGDIPIEMQVKLLRVLEDRRIQRLGGGESRQVQFRLITATNRDMQQLIDAERFRLDLYYRISGVVLHIPALRHRREDIPELLHYFVQGFCRRNGMPVPVIENDILPYLAAQDWPGNVRQLRQRIEEALVFCDLKTLRVADFARHPPMHRGEQSMAQAVEPLMAASDAPSTAHVDAGSARPSRHTLREREYLAVQDTLRQVGGNKKRAAEALGISRSHLYKILARDSG